MNILRSLALALVVFLLFPNTLQAQFTMAKTTEVALVKTRQLVVLSEAPSKKDLEKFSKKDKNGNSEARWENG